jgi:hypothetical protein
VWVDVLSKADLLGPLWERVDGGGGGGGSGSLTGGNGSLTDSSSSSGVHIPDNESSGGEAGWAQAPQGPPPAAALAFARLPGALRVSSLTGDGVGALKEAVMRELAAAAAAAGEGGGAADEGGRAQEQDHEV